MKVFLGVLSLFALFLVSEAARKVDVQSKVRRTLRSIKREGILGGPKPTLEELLALSPDEGLRFKTFAVPRSGIRLNRFGETYKGLPVFGTVVTAQENQRTEDLSEGIKGKIYEGIEEDLPDVTPSLTEKEAFTVAMKSEGHFYATGLDFRDLRSHLMVKINRHNVAELVYYLSYVVEGQSLPKQISKPTYFINAKTGAVILHWEGMRTGNHYVKGAGGNRKIGKKYYDGQKKLRVNKRHGKCFMENKHVAVYHMNNTRWHPRTTYRISCAQGPKDEVNGAYSPASDAIYFVGQTIKMFREYNLFNFSQMHIRVHYGHNFANAAWDGTYISFGDGSPNTYYPMVALDLSGHEMGHAFTEEFSELIYEFESGAIDEAFSDMTGEAVEHYVRGKNDWLVGNDVVKNQVNGMRQLDSPTKDGKSIDHADDFEDWRDVHYNSGVFNKAFYLLAKKPGWNVKKAFKLFALANKIYWTEDTTFNEAACGVEQAASDEKLRVKDVAQAFSKVGVYCP